MSEGTTSGFTEGAEVWTALSLRERVDVAEPPLAGLAALLAAVGRLSKNLRQGGSLRFFRSSGSTRSVLFGAPPKLALRTLAIPTDPFTFEADGSVTSEGGSPAGGAGRLATCLSRSFAFSMALG